MAEVPTFVIVGASLTGAKAAEALRDNGFDGRIVLIGEESERPYERPPLSKGYLQGKDPRDGAYVHEQGWYAQHQVELRLGVRVTGVDPIRHTVTLAGRATAGKLGDGDGGSGDEELSYDKLLLATGSRVRRLDVPGGDLAGVRYLRSLPQSDALLERLRDTGGDGGRVVVIGAGWIGLESAAAARMHGAEVTVVERGSLPLQRVLGDEVAHIFADLHRAHGVDFRVDSGVREFRGVRGVLKSVVLSDGTELPADVAVVGVGIEPATELAQAAGLVVDNGVVTDAMLGTSDRDIFAAGDVANALNPLLGKRIRVEHWSNALNGGTAVARSMLGESVPYDRVPYFFSDQYDLGMEYAGWVEPDGYDRVVFREDPTVRGETSPEFVGFWVKDGRVLAGMNVNVWDVQDDIQALVRAGYAGRSVDLAKLADSEVPLSDLLT